MKIKVRYSPFSGAISFKMLIAGFQISRCCYANALLMKCEYLTSLAILYHGLTSNRYQFNILKHHIIYAKARIHLRKLKQFKEGCVVGNVTYN